MYSDWPPTRDLVLVGGGHTHALVLRRWGMARLPGARVTLINPGPSGPYTGMLPGHIAGHYSRAELDIDLVRLARFAGARIIFDLACGIDRLARLIHLEGRPPVRYDVASIDIGVTAGLPEIEGFGMYAHSVKPLGPFADALRAFLERLSSADVSADCVVIGGGVAGVELALALAHRLQNTDRAKTSVTLLEARPDMLRDVGAQTRKVLLKALSDYRVSVLTNVQVFRINRDTIEFADGRSLPAGFVVSAAGARPHPWLAAAGFANTDGFIDVGPDLRTLTDDQIFAAGDCAHLVHAPRPKAGVYAVREAPILFDNLRAALSGGDLRSYHPQAVYLKLISTGRQSAVGTWHSITISGPWVWSLKDRIDGDFMSGLSALPAITTPTPPAVRALDDEGLAHHDPLCGGCGSKVGRESLVAALGIGPSKARTDVVVGIGDDAAVIQFGSRQQVISTDHLRAFIDDPYLLARIAAVHALGDIWAMGAAPQSGLLSLVIPRMSERLQSATVSEVVAAVRDVLHEAGAVLVGGHSSMGCELTVGLTVTGLLDGPAIGLNGAQPGDALILTKPLGTGVILAADMRRLARGDHVETALRSMQRPVAAAARLLASFAHAMTDVTGFGLAGHLMTILEASEVSAEVSLSSLPILPGAADLSDQGIRSSIWPSNAKLDRQILRPASAISDLVHDPQTAGGLLAAIPADAAPGLLSALKDAGEPAFHIGEIQDGAPRIVFI